MPQLTKRMFKTSRSSMNPPGLFGLREDQMVGGINNAGWYNDRGEFLGYGDITLKCVTRIMAEIDPKEVFVILTEEDWRLRRHPELQKENGYEQVPIDFLARHALLLLRRDMAYWCCRRHQYEGTRSEWGLPVKIASDDERVVSVIAGLVT